MQALTDEQQDILSQALRMLRPAFGTAQLRAVAAGALMADFYRGEQVRIYAPSRNAIERAEQRRRVAVAVASGENAQVIAKREGVHASTVRRMRGVLCARITP